MLLRTLVAPAIVIALSSTFRAVASDSSPESPWWNPAFAHRQALGLRGDLLPGPAADFPLLVRLDPGRFPYSQAATDGADLRFVADDGSTVLPHEIESWNPSGVSLVWVRIPSIDPTVDDQRFWCYWGDPDAPDGQQPAAVWDHAYDLVVHGSTAPADSSPGGHTLGAQGSVDQADWELGTALALDGADAIVTSDYAAPTDVLTYSAWLNWDGGSSKYPRLFEKTDGASFPEIHCFVNRNRYSGPVGHLRLQQQFADGGGDFWADRPLPERRWVHVAIVSDRRDGSIPPRIFFDGEEIGGDERNQPGGAYVPGPGTFHFGNHPDLKRVFTGSVDEIRFAHALRDPAWIRAEYLAGADRLIDYFGTAIAAEIPESSVFSPAFVEARIGPERTVQVEADGVPVEHVRIGEEALFVYAPLARDAATTVAITNDCGTVAEGAIAWETLDFAGSPSVEIPVGTSILVAGTPGEEFQILTESGTAGTATVDAGGAAEILFPDTGAYQVVDGSGGRIDVMAVGAAGPDPIGCQIGYRRRFVLAGNGTADRLEFAAAEPRELAVGEWDGELPASGIALALQASPSDPSYLIGRIGDGGPIAYAELCHPFELGSNLEGGFIYHRDQDGFGHTTFRLFMRPPVAGQIINVDFFTGGTTVNGASVFDVRSEDLDENGEWSGELLMLPDSTTTCHRLRSFDLVPSGAAQ